MLNVEFGVGGFYGWGIVDDSGLGRYEGTETDRETGETSRMSCILVPLETIDRERKKKILRSRSEVSNLHMI